MGNRFSGKLVLSTFLSIALFGFQQISAKLAQTLATANCPNSDLVVFEDVAEVKPASALPKDGWAVFTDNADNAAYVTRIKNYDPKPILHNGKKIKNFMTRISPDLKWALLANGKSEKEVKPILYHFESKKTFELDIEANNSIDWWNNSPREIPEQKIWEMAYQSRDGRRAYGQLMDLSDENNPKLLDSRLIAEDMNGGGVEFHIAGDLFIWDYAEAYLFTIPDGGLGVATWEDRYPVKISANNCGLDMAPSANYWHANTNIRNYSCSPGDHQGFFILKTKKSTDEVITGKDWVWENEHSRKIVFTPKTIQMNGQSISQRNGDDNHWFGTGFTNDENYMTVFHKKNDPDINSGAYILDINTGVHYEIVPPTRNLMYAVNAYFEGTTFPEWTNRPQVSLFIKTPIYKKVYRTGESLELSAEVNSKTKTISKVEFFLGSDKVGEATSAPWSVTLNAVPEGKSTVKVTVTTSDNQKINSQRTLIGEEAPVATIIKPKVPVWTVGKGQQIEIQSDVADQYSRPLEAIKNEDIAFSIESQGGSFNGSVLTAGNTEGIFKVTMKKGSLTGEAQIQVVEAKAIGQYLSEALIMTANDGYPLIRKNWNKRTNFITQKGDTLHFTDNKDRVYSFEPVKATVQDGIPYIYNGPHHIGNRGIVAGFNIISPSEQTVKIKRAGGRFSMSLLIVNDEVIKSNGGKELTNPFTLKKGTNSIVIWTLKSKPVGFQIVDEADNLVTGLKSVLPTAKEVIAEGYKITSPLVNASYKVGDVIPIDWIAGEDEEETSLSVLIEGIPNEFDLLGQSIMKDDENYGHYEWKIPSKMLYRKDGENKTVILNDQKITVRVKNYLEATIKTEVVIQLKGIPDALRHQNLIGSEIQRNFGFENYIRLYQKGKTQSVNTKGQLVE